MATPKKEVAVRLTATELAAQQEKIAALMERQQKMEASVQQSAPRYTVKAGRLMFNGEEVPNSEIVCSIVWNIFENVRYDTEFDPDNPAAPDCWAKGDDDKNMIPHDIVIAAGNNKAETCKQCPYDAYGSADRGKGKGCQNRRNLVTMVTGTLVNGKYKPFTEAELEASELIIFSVPPTSFKAINLYVKTVGSVTGKPIPLVNTRIKVAPSDNQYEVKFSLESEIQDKFFTTILKKIDLAEEIIMAPYPLPEVRPVNTKSKTGGSSRSKSTAAKPTATKKTNSRY
jgi:hypothetical protein